MRAMSLDDFVPTTYLHPSPIANQDDGQSNPSSGSLTPRNAAMTPKGTSPESSTSPADISDESDEGEMNSDGGEVLSGSGGGQVEKSGEPFVEDDGIHPDEGVTRSRRGDEIRESGKHTVEEASGDGGETGQPIYEEECGENETAFVEAGNAGSA